MRTLRRNKQPLKYALQIGEVPIYERDDDGNIVYYEDGDGNKYPMITGEYHIEYGTPVNFMENISMSGGEAEAVEYGLDTSQYEAVIVYANGSVPLVEGALIWHKSDVEYRYGGEEVEVELEDGTTIVSKFPIDVSADYRVIKINESLNMTRAILKAMVK